MKHSPFPAINRELLRFKAFYFFFLSGFGSLLPYLPVYFRQIGLSAHHVGLLIGLRPIVQFASAPFWAIMADKYKKRKPILVMSILSWLIMTLALAFVEPTREICEMRVENHTILQFVNYTKIKTGFFKRSVRTLTSDGHTKTALKLVALPVNLTSLNKTEYKNKTQIIANQKSHLNSHNTERVDLQVHQSQSSETKRTSYSIQSSHYPLRGYRSASVERIKSSFLRQSVGQKIRGDGTKSKGSQQMNTKPVDYNRTMKTVNGFRKKKRPALPRRLPSFRNHKNPRKLTKTITNSRNVEYLDLKTSNTAGDLHGTVTGTLKAGGNIIKQKRWDEPSEISSTTSTDVSVKTGVIEFSKADSTIVQNQSSNDTQSTFDEKNVSGSGDQEMSGEQQEQALRSRNVSIPKHVKEAAEKLQKQLTKSINFLNNIANNSSEVLLHHTISMFAKKNEDDTHTATPKTIPQLSNAINDFMKSNQKYSSSRNLEGSAEGSSVLLSSEHDLSNFAMDHMINSPKHGLNTPDNLHQEDPKQTNKGVIHHNVLPHHVLAFSHNNTTGWPMEQIDGNTNRKTSRNTTGWPMEQIDGKTNRKTSGNTTGWPMEQINGKTNRKTSRNTTGWPMEQIDGKTNRNTSRNTTGWPMEQIDGKTNRNTSGNTTGWPMEQIDGNTNRKTSGNTTGWPMEQIDGNTNRKLKTLGSGEGSEITRIGSNESLPGNVFFNFTKVNMSDRNATDKLQHFINQSSGKPVDNGPTEKQANEQEEEYPSSETKQTPPSTFSGIVSQVHTTLRNLVKTNKNEMTRVFTVFLVLVVVGEFLESPSATLADASLLEVLGENRQFYGKQRLFGSIGFGVCSFIVGILLERSRHVVCGDQYTDYMICFCAFSIMMFLTLLVTTSFEFHYSDTQSSSGQVLSSLFNMHYGSCLFAACVMGIDFSMSHNFLTWFLEDLGASKALMGLAVISRCFADTVTFYFAGSIIKCIGHVHVMIMVLISYTVILLTYSVLHNPWWIIPVEVLDGVTYALAWSVLTSYLAGAVPSGSVTTLQGILQGVYWGLGTGTGTITGGYLIHHVGVVTTFRLTAGFTFLMCLLFSTAQWKWTNSVPSEHPQTKYTYLPTVETKDTDELLSGYYRPGNQSNSTKAKLKNPY